jgi:hypothetical protein
MAELLFYSNPVSLNRESHKAMKVNPPDNYGFASNTNSVIVTGIEFTEASRHYPVVFTRVNERVIPVAVLGLKDNQNLFVDADGNWQADYIPAFVRRYPFVLASAPDLDEDFYICVDESSLSSESGQALFDEEGNESEYLQNASRFMQDYHRQYLKTLEFGEKLDELGILEQMSARYSREDDEDFVLGQFETVNENALLRLTTANADDLFRSGYLGWIYAHLISVGRFKHLANRIN